MNILTLSIKKIYFDRILNGEKIYEYREKKPYFDRIFGSRKIDFLELHYFKEEKLIIEVLDVEIIDNNLDSNFLKTDKLYKINLGKIINYQK